MLTLTRDDVRLGCRAADWREALAQAAQALTDAHRVSAEYREGLLAREAQSSTYLGNGIAIPHGTPESRRYVRSTGVRVLQFPEGLTWHDGHRVNLLVTIAAQSDEHLDILRQLTHVLEREGVAEALARATHAEEVIALLSRVPVTAKLDAETLCLGLPVRDRLELALIAAARLRHAGCVDAAFVAAIAGQTPVSLGQGLWLVHGTTGVQSPGLALATPERRLQDDAGDVAGVFCLAAQGDAHRSLLERLDGMLARGDGAQLAGLPGEQILARLAGESAQAQTARVRLLNAHGLHARPARELVQVARTQSLPVRVRLLEGSGEAVSTSSLTKVIGLGARRGQTLVFSAEGDGAAQAVSALAEAVRNGLGEAVMPIRETQEEDSLPLAAPKEPPVPPKADELLTAIPASPGIAIAPAYVLKLPTFQYPERAANAAQERQRLERALQGGHEQLEALVKRTAGGEVAQILSIHAEMLEDPALREAAFEAIGEGLSAEAGWWRAIDTAARNQEALADRLLAERAADLRDVGRRVLGLLCGVEIPAPPEHPYVLVADDVGPSDVARLDTAKVRGLVTARGGATSHSAILARALGIAAVVGAGERVLTLNSGTELIVDGENGRIITAPSLERRQRSERRLHEQQELQKAAYGQRHEAARTLDGHRVEVGANLGDTAHAADAVARGAEGVGLLRTEFVFMAHSQMPDLATQIAEYGEAFDALAGRPLVARTLDVGGDKPLAYWPMPREDNPFLGVRGIRLTLTRPEVLETQLRALLTAAGSRPVRIMFPMIKDIEEFRAGKALFDRVQAEVKATDVQLGVMIEVPSCALLAPTLAKEADFFSIGTNDLTQYTLAIDRGHPMLSAQSDALHPAVLRLIRLTVEAAHAEGRWVGVCGELGSDPLAIPVLVGLGVDELSVSSRSVPMVKARIRGLTLTRARELAELALRQSTAAGVREAMEAA
ncbi:phosphoenolpyruvate--protein phosphotransferase [Stigmatella sp. ncwal1]|uniref:phosphoenolpyruvate--protein phosphotransferase n=1 Tax=Stigmatella ashevillensis TaxID=2995309 RepID=A0ABT5D2F9_9BACT|nr:phosphoenolpyruvate--protein phosphotransferase [Stigmatella ashevillena]MDC0707827.1 phosphoenolpyruvate--protein phosphotransferase [Stigmatella ashevillena]